MRSLLNQATKGQLIPNLSRSFAKKNVTDAASTPKATKTVTTAIKTITNESIIELDDKFVCHNYKPCPVAISRAKGLYAWDVEGKKYMDFLNGYSSSNQGHCHPEIVKALITQAKKVTLTSRAFHNDQLGQTAEYLTKLLGFDKFLPMNSGVEACESAVKLARRWGYDSKNIEDNKAEIVVASNCFWGRSITASGACDDPLRYSRFGPFTPGFHIVPYNDANALEKLFQNNPNICGVMLEPIQGEAGVVIPSENYFKEVSKLCKKYKVLLICDEVQTGFGRTGKMMAHEWDGIKPDMITVGKALSGGMMPVSGVFANNNIMDLIKPGEHGSTYGGNPLAMAVAKRAVEVIVDEKLVENAQKMGQIFDEQLRGIKSHLIKEVRGRGLFYSIELKSPSSSKIVKVNGNEFSSALRKRGLLSKPTHDTTLRFAPALTITEKELLKACRIIRYGIRELEKLNRQKRNEEKKQ